MYHGYSKFEAEVKLNGVKCSLVASLFADDTLLLAESEKGQQRVVDEF